MNTQTINKVKPQKTFVNNVLVSFEVEGLMFLYVKTLSPPPLTKGYEVVVGFDTERELLLHI